MEKLQFQTNIPETIALKFARGKQCQSDYGDGVQFMYSTTDGRIIFASPALNAKIEALEANARTPITICKTEKRNEGKVYTEWAVSRPEQAPRTPAPEPSGANQDSRVRNSPQSIIPSLPMDRALLQFLLAAGRATRDAEKILGSEGGSVRFDSRDIAATATTMLIHAGKEGWLTWLSPETVSAPPVKADAKPSAATAIPWKNRGELKSVYAGLRESLGDGPYLATLAEWKVSTPEAFLESADGPARAEACYRRLIATTEVA